jgi:hypothetical protein
VNYEAIMSSLSRWAELRRQVEDAPSLKDLLLDRIPGVSLQDLTRCI